MERPFPFGKLDGGNARESEAEKMATVLKIPAKFHPITHLPETKVQKRRVAAYARVSTDSEEQQTSYAAQVDRYTKYIQERAD